MSEAPGQKLPGVSSAVLTASLRAQPLAGRGGKGRGTCAREDPARPVELGEVTVTKPQGQRLWIIF